MNLHFRDTEDVNSDDGSDIEKGSVDGNSLEPSSDSEMSLRDEPLMEIQVSFSIKLRIFSFKYVVPECSHTTSSEGFLRIFPV